MYRKNVLLLQINYRYFPEVQFCPNFLPAIFVMTNSDLENLKYFYRGIKVPGVFEYCQNERWLRCAYSQTNLTIFHVKIKVRYLELKLKKNGY